MYCLNYGSHCLDTACFKTLKEAKLASSCLPNTLWFILKVEDTRTLLKACSLNGASYGVIDYISACCILTREQVENKIYQGHSK